LTNAPFRTNFSKVAWTLKIKTIQKNTNQK
jgi:hypothetical protein